MQQRHELIAIIDFGSQYTQLIARRIREAHVYSEIFVPQVSVEGLLNRGLKGIILSGGPRSIYEKDAPTCNLKIFDLGVPVLGICYGMQLMGHKLGGHVIQSKSREYGRTRIKITKIDQLFDNIPREFTAWMSHADIVKKLPKDFIPLALTDYNLLAAMTHQKRPLYAVQFHPEVIHTGFGDRILKNFLMRICKCSGDWKIGSLVDSMVNQIAQKVNKSKIICGLSGGVDSTTTAALVNKVAGKNLTCIFVNNGVLRKNEPEMLLKTFKKLRFNIDYVDASNIFLRKLKGIIDPEEKRRIIGHLFIKIFERKARAIKGVKFLAQGTLYPDVIESRSAFGGPSAKIKTHHNVGGLPARLKLQLVEPLKFLFKDEVRILAKELGLPGYIINRQPFPGPGLAVRIVGDVTQEKLEILRQADEIIGKEIQDSRFASRLWQYFAVLLPVKTVGVMGDARTYENVIAIRVVESRDGMTADWAKLPLSLLDRISGRVTNEVKGVNRVVYDVSSKPPSTIEWE